MIPRAIVIDIEGTASSLSFVHDVLFPYARARLPAYVAAHPGAVAPILDEVRAARSDLAMEVPACVAQLLQWHDEDRKIGPLKTLQGMIWAQGYASGELRGHVYPDALANLKRWREEGVALYVYSSGSVAAQKSLFGHTEAGDITPLFSGFFDTAIGGKKEAASYRAIAAHIGFEAGSILFLSDVEEELIAAREAGMAVTLLARDGAPAGANFPVAMSFDGIVPTAHAA